MSEKTLIKAIQNISFFPKDVNVRNILYYDETNNIRKLVLRENGFNNEVYGLYFVLGGVGIPSNNKVDTSKLFETLNLSKSTTEFKFKTLVNNKVKKFENVIRSNQILLLLTWMHNNNLYIHYLSMNILYFSLADITDSLPYSQESKDFLLGNYREVKDELYFDFVKKKEQYYNLFYKYKYPNINNDNIKRFKKELFNLFIEKAADDSILKKLYEMSLYDESLVFLTNNYDYIVVDTFISNYINQIMRFENSTHILDLEEEIKNMIDNNYSDLYDVTTLSFKDSKDEVLIQTSDVVVGIISSLFTFLEMTSWPELVTFISNLKPNETKTIQLIFNLIKSGEKISQYNNGYIGTNETLLKFRFLLAKTEQIK